MFFASEIISSLYFTPPSPDSLADSLEQPPAQADRQNGGHSDAAREAKEKEAKRKGSQEDSSTAGPSRGREEGGERSQHKVQVRVALPDSVSADNVSLKFMHKHKVSFITRPLKPKIQFEFSKMVRISLVRSLSTIKIEWQNWLNVSL